MPGIYSTHIAFVYAISRSEPFAHSHDSTRQSLICRTTYDGGGRKRKTGILQKLCTDAHSYIVESITRLYFQNEFQINHMQI